VVAKINIKQPATEENFDEGRYLKANPDVSEAVVDGLFKSGWHHFDNYGRNEGRQLDFSDTIDELRASKMERLKPFLRTDMDHVWRGLKADYLTETLRAETKIISTSAVSANDYDGYGMDLIQSFPDGLVLDCGAGSRGTYYDNVVNYEIVDYPSTDVLGVGESLPFKDDSMDAVISVAVLEHVRDPFKCAREISRVLKPGGRLYCAVPFLQPYHGYPHHYFNATAQGISRLFEDELVVTDVDVIDSTHPVHALTWILSSWNDGLPPHISETFKNMRVGDLLSDPMRLVAEDFCTKLPKDKQLELACATVLQAHKSL
jgi:SAM-dependent methyltransferase